MPLNRSKGSGSVQNKEQLSLELRHKRLTLLIQQVGKEAQDRLNELESKMENLMATVDKVFAVALMKMPPSLKDTPVGDLISEDGISASDVSIVMKSESREMSLPLRRIPSKRAKSTDSPPVSSTSGQTSSSKTSKSGKGTKRTRTLAASNSAGNLKASSVTVKRTQSCLMNNETISRKKTPKLRSVVSAGDLQCSVAGSAAHITVTTAQGQMVSFSEENKDDINWDLLDDVALCHIKKLTSLMEYLSQKSRCQR